MVVKAEDLVVERNLGRAPRHRCQIGQRGGLKSRAGDQYLGTGRNRQVQSFIVQVEERLVLADRTAEGSRPLVGMHGRGRQVGGEIILGVQSASVPVVLGVAVPVVGAG